MFRSHFMIFFAVFFSSVVVQAQCDPQVCTLTTGGFIDCLPDWQGFAGVDCNGNQKLEVLDLVCIQNHLRRTFEPVAALRPVGINFNSVAVVGEHVYGLGYAGGGVDWLCIFSIVEIFALPSFSEIPPLAQSTGENAQWDLVFSYGGYLYLCGIEWDPPPSRAVWGFIKIYSLANPLNPVLENTVFPNDYVQDAWIEGNQVFLAESEGIEIFSLADPVNPSFVGLWSCSYATHPETIAVHGQKIYIGTYDDILKTLDQSDQTNLTVENSISLSDYPYHLLLDSGKLILSHTDHLRLYDLTDPAVPGLLDTFSTISTGGRVLAYDRGTFLGANVMVRVAGDAFESLGTFSQSGGNNGDGSPYGSAVYEFGHESLVFLTQRIQILALRTN